MVLGFETFDLEVLKMEIMRTDLRVEMAYRALVLLGAGGLARR